MRQPIIVVALCGFACQAWALDTKPLPKSLVEMLAHLAPIYPSVDDWPRYDSDPPRQTDWELRIWSVEEMSECTEENFSDSCRGHTVFITISEWELGGKRFGFRAGPAFSVSVRSIAQIPAESNSGRTCALFTLEERVKVNPKKPRWEVKITHICATPRGFVKYRPTAAAGAKP